jgi:hypothetical protein
MLLVTYLVGLLRKVRLKGGEALARFRRGGETVAEAWSKQSASLKKVQVAGGNLEKELKKVLGWPGGRVIYHAILGYDIQVDSVFPDLIAPGVIVSSTYTNPDTRGHSNENKLHLKIGELALLKHAFPDIRVVLAIGGAGEAWLPYVLDVFSKFYDEVLFLWREEDLNRLGDIRNNPGSVRGRNTQLWNDMRADWNQIQLWPDGSAVPQGLVRYQILDVLKQQVPRVHNPKLILNPIARLCMQRYFERGGAEWDSYIEGRWHNIEMSRNYFNPVEATVEISLTRANLNFQGGIAQDVEVPSLLHDFGMAETSLSEDFVLTSQRLNLPVYIQCKASGGGRDQHGKNIQNRAKEQITRHIFYRCRVRDGQIVWGPKSFHWITVLDGDWGVNQAEPLKYVHMLQWAGYDKIFGAPALLTPENGVREADNPLTRYLITDLNCPTK